MCKANILAILGSFVLGFVLLQVEANASILVSFEVDASDWVNYPNQSPNEVYQTTDDVSSLPISAYVPNAAGGTISNVNFGSAMASSGFAWTAITFKVDTPTNLDLSFDYVMSYFGSGYGTVQVYNGGLSPSFIVSSDDPGLLGKNGTMGKWDHTFSLAADEQISLGVYVDAMHPAMNPDFGGTPGLASAFISNVQFAAVPLPPSVFLLGSGLIWVAGIRRKK
jgi:hypothetical protein